MNAENKRHQLGVGSKDDDPVIAVAVENPPQLAAFVVGVHHELAGPLLGEQGLAGLGIVAERLTNWR